MKKNFAIALLFLLSVGTAFGQTTTDPQHRLMSATTYEGISSFLYSQKYYKGDPEAGRARVSSFIPRLAIAKHYKEVDADKADILITVQENATDQASPTVSITVRDADTNDTLYTETRDVVSLENDVKRLVKHFLAVVDEEKAEAQAAWNKANAEKQAAREAEAQAARDKAQAEAEAEAQFNLAHPWHVIGIEYDDSHPPVLIYRLDHTNNAGVVSYYATCAQSETYDRGANVEHLTPTTIDYTCSHLKQGDRIADCTKDFKGDICGEVEEGSKIGFLFVTSDHSSFATELFNIKTTY